MAHHDTREDASDWKRDDLSADVLRCLTLRGELTPQCFNESASPVADNACEVEQVSWAGGRPEEEETNECERRCGPPPAHS